MGTKQMNSLEVTSDVLIFNWKNNLLTCLILFMLKMTHAWTVFSQGSHFGNRLDLCKCTLKLMTLHNPPPPSSIALCMGVPDHPTLSLSSFTDKPTPPHTLCRAMPPITTQGALAKAGLGEQLDGVWVR